MSERTNGIHRPKLQSQSDSDETHQINLSPEEFSDLKGRFLDSLEQMVHMGMVEVLFVDDEGMEVNVLSNVGPTVEELPDISKIVFGFNCSVEESETPFSLESLEGSSNE